MTHRDAEQIARCVKTTLDRVDACNLRIAESILRVNSMILQNAFVFRDLVSGTFFFCARSISGCLTFCWTFYSAPSVDSRQVAFTIYMAPQSMCLRDLL